MICLWALVMAFEFHAAGAREAAMVAAGAGDWIAALSCNPALSLNADRVNLVGGCCQPFGLDRVQHVTAAAATQRSNWALAAGVTSLGFERYRETQAVLCGGMHPLRAVTFGAGVRWLVVDQGSRGVDMAPAFDIGATWQSGKLVLAAAGRAVNRPGLGTSGAVQQRLVLAVGVTPVEDLRMLADFTLESEGAAGAFGCELLLLSQLAIRAGVGTGPLVYAGGIGLRVGPVGLDYACRFHPQLKETHQLNLSASWH
jgi:hypothetical protein